MNARRVAILVLALGVLLAVTQTYARAEGLDIAGTTSGSAFYQGSTYKGGQVIELDYNSTTFGPTPLVAGTVLHLGSFQIEGCQGWLLGWCSDDYTPYTFKLKLTFSEPPGTLGQTLVADVIGEVDYEWWQLHRNDVKINFDQTPINFDFASGSFTLVMNDVNAIPIDYGRADITATVTSVVPEPASMLLIGGALIGLGVLYRRRK